MEADKLQELIEKYFVNSEKERQIVFWYDENGENQDKLDSISFSNIKVHKLTGTNNLLTKKLLEHDDTTSNYLIYAPFEKPEPSDNWFLDTQLYSKEFTFDEVANLCSEFDIYENSVKNLLREHLKFFNNRERVSKLKTLLTNKTPDDFYIGMLAVLVKGKLPDINKITQRYIISSLIKQENVEEEFEKYGLNERFWNLVKKQFGYEGERNAKLLLASIIFGKLKQQLSSSNFPQSYEKYLNKKISTEVECNLFLENWYRDSELCPYYKDISKIIETDFKIKDNITDWTDIITKEPEFTTLEIFDKALIMYLINNFESLKCEDKKILEKRKNTLFYDNYKNVYSAIYWAIELKNLIQNNPIIDQTAEKFVKKYTSDYFRIDKAYRKFYYFSQKSNARDLDSIKEYLEKAYVNNYLDNLCSKFSNQLKDLAPVWKIQNIPMQKDFYHREIKPLKVKTVVIISDALRYEIAEDLMQTVKNNYQIKADLSLEYMLGSIPTYTKLGMASLLPYENMTINQRGDYVLDGISTESSQNREKVLNTKCEKAKVLSIKDFDDLKADEAREIFRGLDVAYVYQDRIDYTGENAEKDVFEAAEKAIEEINEKIKFIFNNSLAGNVIVTADHGFLYQYSDLEERQKITIGNIQAVKSNKRFVLANEPIQEVGVMNFDMDYILKDSKLTVSVPFNINRFKTSGSGINYVHGGASLQEVVIPVLKIKQNKKQEIRKVSLVLENTSRRITNNKFVLSFLQKESISETVKPRRFSVSMWDIERNVQISNELYIDANIESNNMEDRIFKKTLELRSFEQEKKDYWLIVKDVDEIGEPEIKLPFTINLVFSSDFDF